MLSLYPEIMPFKTHMLPREPLPNGQQHEIYIEQCGNPLGLPVVFLHGGPGSGCNPLHRRFFDPDKYHIILFDQRGCGRSRPLGCIENNNTEYLVEDIEAIRNFFEIEQWVIFGGSWGSTLALSYARQYSETIHALILRGSFLGRPEDIDWVYASDGAAKVFPEAWQSLVEHLPIEQHERPLGYFYEKLFNESSQTQLSFAKILQNWEATIVKTRDVNYVPDNDDNSVNVAHSVIQLHFALNHCFLDDKPLLPSLTSLSNIPIQLIHGRYDMVCPVEQSWLLKQALPHASLTIVPLAGHAASEPGLIDALVKATNKLVY